MSTDAWRRLKALQKRCASVLADITPHEMNMQCTEDRSVRDVIGLLLIDLDRLASGSAAISDGVPRYASAFMDRRLAGRWTARYRVEAVAAETDRRFAKALATLPERLAPEHEQALARLDRHWRELATAIRQTATADG